MYITTSKTNAGRVLVNTKKKNRGKRQNAWVCVVESPRQALVFWRMVLQARSVSYATLQVRQG